MPQLQRLLQPHKQLLLTLRDREGNILIDGFYDGIKPPTEAEKEAIEKANKTDKRRASYYNFYSDKEWGVASSYNLSVDSSLLGTEDTARMIKEFVEKRLSLIDRYGVLLPRQ